MRLGEGFGEALGRLWEALGGVGKALGSLCKALGGSGKALGGSRESAGAERNDAPLYIKKLTPDQPRSDPILFFMMNFT